MTKRPTTTTALSANFQASNALHPLLRMQHPALRQRVHFATMRHPAEEPESSASSRSPDSFNGSDSHRTVRAVFLFLRRKRSPPLSLLPTRRSNYRRHRHCHRAASTAQQSVRQQALPVPAVRTATTENDATSPIHREADAKCRRKKGSIGRKLPHLFAISRNDFEQVPVHGAMCPDNAYDQPTPRRL